MGVFIYFNFTYVFLCTVCTPGALGGQKRAWDALALKFQIIVNCPLGAGNGTHDLYKNSLLLTASPHFKKK